MKTKDIKKIRAALRLKLSEYEHLAAVLEKSYNSTRSIDTFLIWQETLRVINKIRIEYRDVSAGRGSDYVR